MCAGMALFPKVSSLCANLHQNPQQAYPTFGLGLQYLPNAYWSAFAPNAALRRWQLLQVGTGTVLTQCPLQIDECILHYLMGESYYDDRLSHLLKPLSDRDADPLPPSHDRVVRELVEIWETPDPLCDSVRVQLTGWESNDKSAIVAAAGDRLNRPVKVLLCDRLPTDQENITFIIKRWQREYTLTQSFLLLDCDALNLSDPTKRATVLQLIDDLNTPFAIATRERIYHSRSPLRTFEIAPLTYHEKLELWQTHLGETAVTLNGRVETIVAQFNLSQTSIKTACQSLRKSTIHSLSSDEVNDAEDPDIESDRLWNICRTMARSRLDDMARRIETKATWDDLILPEKQLKTLQEIAAQFRQQAKVIQEWGFSRKNSRGLGMTSLFSGPSGTGKTTAAEVLAREFNLDLYRIDLSSVVSKYIGETEKNLRRIFDAAESGSAVLLFDEADALFGKRTEVKDSRDRHANVEVSYLLQRMEAYQGLAILTTNLKKALDQAFLRRIRFIVSFPFPNNQARGEIWARIFPAETPTQGLDPKKLASLSLSG